MIDRRNTPSNRELRGLRWIHRQALADYLAVSEEKNTGQFTGTNAAEVDAALDWLNKFLMEHGK
jgi:hypothetical protein